MRFGEYIKISEPIIETMYSEENGAVVSATGKACVLWRERADDCIIDEIIKMLKENGVTDLYVLNRGFILAAIREKMEKEK